MGETKGAPGRKNGMRVDTKLVRELADLLAETGLFEIEVEDDGQRIRVARGPAGGAIAAAPAYVAAAAPAPAAAPATAEAPAASAAPDLAGAIKSPMVGTAYLSAEPGSPAFVKVGDTVKAGDTLLIVEAMKVMNPITAPNGGTVKAILIENAQPVEYDQPLIVVA
jgi:acetyl-CoA carboxylase biotin carboxyl carrier protein